MLEPTEYYRSEKNKNCPSDQVVNSTNECKTAATELELKYKNSLTRYYRPAGCYRFTNLAYFNEITNTSKTWPEKGDLTTFGICRKKGTLFLRYRPHAFKSNLFFVI